jgi:succinyl-diaminopimelate desuccinylase
MTNSKEIDIAQKLIRCKSIAPKDGGALKIVEKECKAMGFKCTKLRFSEKGFDTINNLYAEIGNGKPHFSFAGHVDVVPANKKDWVLDPFAGIIKNNFLIGRGAVDMKSAVACFISAAKNYLNENKNFKGKISMMITTDEETYAWLGTRKIIQWLKEKKIKIDNCLVGEPTNTKILGDGIKIGRRGGFNGIVEVQGKEGHSAWPNRTVNPVSGLIKMLSNIDKKILDKGTKHFQPSIISITSVDVGNKALNVIPAKARGSFNIRFNTLHTIKSLTKWIKKEFNKVGLKYKLETYVSGNAFLTKPGKFSELIRKCIKKITRRTPKYTTTGGTSDARFIKDYTNVVEFGLVGETMHTNNERVSLKNLKDLTKIYKLILEEYFK